MKKYFEYINTITADELFEGLLGYGLFAEKIPPFLSSVSFYEYVKGIALPTKEDKEKDYVRYATMRNINVPRQLAIPNPFAYANLCKTITVNWHQLQSYFEQQTKEQLYKVSRIHLRKQKDEKSLFEMNYKNTTDDGTPDIDLTIGSKYIANADISNCFPSIYSHSISWALIGKREAKSKASKKFFDEWFNQLDYYTRNIKNGETNGLLIGPHSSNLISEIILVAIDNELTNKGYNYVRSIDDYSCFCDSFSKAEQFFIDLSYELKKYELTLNNKKSKITQLPQASIKDWVRKLNHFNFTDTYKYESKVGIKKRELQSFLDFSIELMLENSDTSVINYAIKVIAKKHLSKYAIDYYIKQIHHLVLLYPYLINLLENYIFNPFNIDNNTIKQIAENVYKYGLNKKLYEACSYCVYWALKFNFELNSLNLKEDCLQSEDCIFMLISYVYDKKRKPAIELKDYVDNAKELKKEDPDRFWLFIFEVLPWDVQLGNFKEFKKLGNSFLIDKFR